jgi:superfamily II DNA/RNA helicase
MKRKRDQIEPQEVAKEVNESPESADPVVTEKSADSSFSSFNLDSRILQAVAKLKYASPTPVQAKAIPAALQGRDILGRFLP